MATDPLLRLRAANPLPELPAAGSPERVRRLIDDGHEPLAMPYRAPRRNAGLLIAVTVITLLALVTISLAATGLILAGAPVRPEEVLNPSIGVGIPAPGASRLLPLRVADPAGGPPWGMRIVSTTRGEECVQIGRVQDGQLGELGIDGVFHDDGRFHPIPADALPRDEFHHRVFDSMLGTATTSCHLAGEVAVGEHVGVSPSAAAETYGSPRPISGLRNLLYGLLGPQALSVSYRDGFEHHIAPVLPRIGAYLIVTPTKSHQQVGYGDQGLGSPGDLAPIPPLTTITYRIDGVVCRRSLVEPPWVHSHLADACPQLHIRSSPAPIRNLHEPLRVRLLIDHHFITGAEVTFKAPFAVTSAREHYVVFIPRVSCKAEPGTLSGIQEMTARNIARGAVVTLRLPNPFANICAGHPATIEVRYGQFPRQNTLVAGVAVRLPPGTRSQPSPIRPQKHRAH